MESSPGGSMDVSPQPEVFLHCVLYHPIKSSFEHLKNLILRKDSTRSAMISAMLPPTETSLVKQEHLLYLVNAQSETKEISNDDVTLETLGALNGDILCLQNLPIPAKCPFPTASTYLDDDRIKVTFKPLHEHFRENGQPESSLSPPAHSAPSLVEKVLDGSKRMTCGYMLRWLADHLGCQVEQIHLSTHSVFTGEIMQQPLHRKMEEPLREIVYHDTTFYYIVTPLSKSPGGANLRSQSSSRSPGSMTPSGGSARARSVGHSPRFASFMESLLQNNSDILVDMREVASAYKAQGMERGEAQRRLRLLISERMAAMSQATSQGSGLQGEASTQNAARRSLQYANGENVASPEQMDEPMAEVVADEGNVQSEENAADGADGEDLSVDMSKIQIEMIMDRPATSHGTGSSGHVPLLPPHLGFRPESAGAEMGASASHGKRRRSPDTSAPDTGRDNADTDVVLNGSKGEGSPAVDIDMVHTACRDGSMERLNIWLEKYGKSSVLSAIHASTGLAPLHIAVENGHVDLAMAIIDIARECGMLSKTLQEADTEGNTPLHLAAEKGHAGCVQALVSAGALADATKNDGSTPLIVATKSQQVNIGVCRALLCTQSPHGRSDPSKANCQGWTALHYASETGDEELVQLLLKAGANTNIATGEGGWAVGWRPLHFAAYKGHGSIVKCLVGQGASIDAQNEDGETALHLTCECHDEDYGETAYVFDEIMHFLVETGADLEAKTAKGLTALHTAIMNRHEDKAMDLMEAGADIHVTTESGETPLHCAATRASADLISELLDRGASLSAVNSEGMNAFHLICEWIEEDYGRNVGDSRVQCLRALLDSLPESEDAVESTPLNARSGCHGSSPLHLVVEFSPGDEEFDFRIASQLASVLLATQHIDILAKNTNGSTFLHLIASWEDQEFARTLINTCFAAWGPEKTVAVLREQDNSGNTPLHVSCSKNSEVISSLFLSNGANPRAANGHTGWSPLHCAAQYDRINVARLLVSSANGLSGDVDLRAEDGKTSLHVAAAEGSAEILQYLLESKADVNSLDSSGRTALHYACERGHQGKVMCAKELIKANAIVGIPAKDGATPLLISCRCGNEVLASYLLEYGLKIKAGAVEELDVLRTVNIQCTGPAGMTALHFACVNMMEPLVYAIVREGANVRAVDDEGMTPLHYLCLHRKNQAEAAARFLVSHGAYISVLNKNGESPYTLASTKLREVLDESHLVINIDNEVLRQDLKRLLAEGTCADICFQCADSMIPAHRIMFSCQEHCGDLHGMVFNAEKGAVLPCAAVSEHWMLVLEYVYTGIITGLDTVQAAAIVGLARHHKMHYLENLCVDVVSRSGNVLASSAVAIGGLGEAPSQSSSGVRGGFTADQIRVMNKAPVVPAAKLTIGHWDAVPQTHGDLTVKFDHKHKKLYYRHYHAPTQKWHRMTLSYDDLSGLCITTAADMKTSLLVEAKRAPGFEYSSNTTAAPSQLPRHPIVTTNMTTNMRSKRPSSSSKGAVFFSCPDFTNGHAAKCRRHIIEFNGPLANDFIGLLHANSTISRLLVEGFSNFSPHIFFGEMSVRGVADQLRSLLETEEKCDVSLCLTSSESLKAHKAILVARSRTFHAMLLGGMKESEGSEITLPNLSWTVLSDFLEYLYTDNIDGLVPEVALELLDVANQHNLGRLGNICEDVLAGSLDADNVLFILYCADLYQANQLRRACMDVFFRSFGSVVRTDLFATFFFRLSTELVNEVQDTVRPLGILQHLS